MRCRAENGSPYTCLACELPPLFSRGGRCREFLGCFRVSAMSRWAARWVTASFLAGQREELLVCGIGPSSWCPTPEQGAVETQIWAHTRLSRLCAPGGPEATPQPQTCSPDPASHPRSPGWALSRAGCPRARGRERVRGGRGRLEHLPMWKVTHSQKPWQWAALQTTKSGKRKISSSWFVAHGVTRGSR